MNRLSENGIRNIGEHLCLKFHFLSGVPYVKQTDQSAYLKANIAKK